jgi:hypothetical protein
VISTRDRDSSGDDPRRLRTETWWPRDAVLIALHRRARLYQRRGRDSNPRGTEKAPNGFRDRLSATHSSCTSRMPTRSSKPAGRSSPPLGWFDSIAERAPRVGRPRRPILAVLPLSGRDSSPQGGLTSLLLDGERERVSLDAPSSRELPAQPKRLDCSQMEGREHSSVELTVSAKVPCQGSSGRGYIETVTGGTCGPRPGT